VSPKNNEITNNDLQCAFIKILSIVFTIWSDFVQF